MARGTKYYPYGYMGWEQEIDSHIKTRAIFVIADEHKKHLAWYTFAQSLVVEMWQRAFDVAGEGQRKLDRNEILGSALSMGRAFVQSDPNWFDIRKLATPLPGSGTSAFLYIHDDAKMGTTNCVVSIVPSRTAAVYRKPFGPM